MTLFPLTAQSLLHWLLESVLLTVQQVVLVLAPLGIIAWVLQLLARFIRNRIAWTLKADAYVYLTAPGVMIHELGHAFFCVVFRHRIVSMALFKPQADGTLGSVEHAYDRRSLYQQVGNFFIGTGPIWFGTALVYLIARLVAGNGSIQTPHMRFSGDVTDRLVDLVQLAPALIVDAWHLLVRFLDSPSVSGIWLFVALYLVFCIGSHITLSRPDIEGASRGVWLLLAAMEVFNLITLAMGPRVVEAIGRGLMSYLVLLYASCLFIVFVNLALAGGVFLLHRVLRR